MYYIFVRETGCDENFNERYESYLVEVKHGKPEKVVEYLCDENEMIDVAIPLRLTGKTYSERKQALINLAIEVQAADQGGLSWNEVIILSDYFEENGKRYGCLEEFRENAIC